MATEWVTVRNPKSGGTARVPRSALPLMPKWKEVKPSKKATARQRSEPSANPESGETSPERSANGEESTNAV